MSYLVIKSASNATPESYLLTSTTNGPRIAVGGSYIPLSTDMGGGSYEVKVNDGSTTYHVMRTSTSSFSQSASASATFNTTADSPDGLENVTNLTRVSTSNTIYQTRASTSATLTRASTSATLTRASTYETLTRASTYETLTRASTYYEEYQTRESTYGWDYLTGYQQANSSYVVSVRSSSYSAYQSTRLLYGTLTGGNLPYFGAWAGYAFSPGRYQYNNWRIQNNGRYTLFSIDATYTNYLYNFSCYNADANVTEYVSCNPSYDFIITRYYWVQATTGTTYYTQASTYNTIYYTRESIYGYNTRQSVYGYNTRESVSGYATRESVSGYGTRVSTSNTVYETRESISGYSGISTSSSSSSESASGTCWK